MVRYRTAAMSHSQIRSAVQSALYAKYPAPPPEPRDYETEPWAMDVYDGYVIHSGGPGKGMYKQSYKLADDGSCELTGDPVEVEPGYVEKGKASLVLQAKAVTTDDAAALLEELKEANPLVGSLSDSPNSHLVVFDLTTIGKPSNHEGEFKYQLSKAGIADALPTLISKPVHVTDGFDGHFTAGKNPTAIGTFIGGCMVKNADGSESLRAVATLWDSDFPEIIADLKAKRKDLGASYEISYLAASASRLSGHVIEIGEYKFSGGAILYKDSAAHPETQLLVASLDPAKTFDVIDDNAYSYLDDYLHEKTKFSKADTLSYQERSTLKDSEFALIQKDGDRTIRRFPIQDEAHRKNAWARLSQAKNLSEAERSEVANKIINRAKSAGDSWAKDYTKSGGQWTKKAAAAKETTMPKYPGITVELEPTVDLLISSAVAAALKEQEASFAKYAAATEPDADDERKDNTPPQFLKKKKAEIKLLTEKVAELTTKVEAAAATETKLAEATAALDLATKELAAKTETLDKIEVANKLATTIAGLQAKYGLTDEQVKEKDRAPLIAKLAAGKEPVSIDEFTAIVAGGKVVTANGGDPKRVPLMAGAGSAVGADGREPVNKEQIAVNFPAATKKAFR